MDHVPPQYQHDADAVGGDRRAVLNRPGRALLVGLALLAAAGFAGLGIWQIERRAWKLDLIARIEARVHAPAAPPPNSRTWAVLDRQAYEYRRIRISGTFEHAAETTVQAVTERGAGWWVITPLRTPGGIVLINRGFVPQKQRDAATRAAGQIAGPVTVTGLMRVTEPDGGFLRTNDPAANRWFSRDVAAIARARRLGPVAPFFVDADAAPNPGGYPIGGLTVVRFSNSHLVYALTWFALAALSAVAAWLIVRTPKRA